MGAEALAARIAELEAALRAQLDACVSYGCKAPAAEEGYRDSYWWALCAAHAADRKARNHEHASHSFIYTHWRPHARNASILRVLGETTP